MFDSLVNERRQSKYTVEQAFRGIQAFVTENCGDKVVFELDEPLTNFEQAARDSHECPLEFLEDLANYFQFQWSENRWAIWLKLRDKSLKAMTKKQRRAAWERWQREIAPRFTVRRLAELIARKARVPSFEPVTIFGNCCESAGIFLGLCNLPEVKEERYAPSTPLRTLRSSQRIRDFWRRAEWISGVTLPRLKSPSPWRLRSPADVVLFVSCCMALTASIIVGILVGQSNAFFLAFFAAVVVGAIPLCAGSSIADRIHNPLPQGLEKFGDLARLIAIKRRQAP